MNFSGTHPLRIIDELRSLRGDSLLLNFSRYRYRPQSPIDERETFSVSISMVDNRWLLSEIEALPDGWELALNSTVIDGRNRKFHIPMIDFVGRDASMIFSGHYRDVLGRNIVDQLQYFDSGRSFHAYSPVLVSKARWLKLMGSLLLLNLPDAEPFIDSRWIGHRLRAGYSALRWSARTSQYRIAPHYIDKTALLNKARRKGEKGVGDII